MLLHTLLPEQSTCTWSAC